MTRLKNRTSSLYVYSDFVQTLKLVVVIFASEGVGQMEISM